MTLRQKIEKILDDRNIGFDSVENELKVEILDEIMNEISKEVYGKPLHGRE